MHAQSKFGHYIILKRNVDGIKENEKATGSHLHGLEGRSINIKRSMRLQAYRWLRRRFIKQPFAI